MLTKTSQPPVVEVGKLATGITMQIAGILTLDLGLLVWGLVVPEHIAGLATGGLAEPLLLADTPAQIAVGGYLVAMGGTLIGGGTLLVAKSFHLSSLWHKGEKK